MFNKIVKQRLDELGVSAIRLALDNDLPRDAIRSVLRGHPPSIERACDIASALNLEFYIGPHRDLPQSTNLNQSQLKSDKSVHNDWGEQITSALKLPRDATLDDVLTVIETLLHPQPNDVRWATLEAEITALRADIKLLSVRKEDTDAGTSTPPATPCLRTT